jgi:uncharacterized membrane protein YeaQ/YmgE (transglycosylase-associated protein family)
MVIKSPEPSRPPGALRPAALRDARIAKDMVDHEPIPDEQHDQRTAGVIARYLSPGSNNPSGFVLTTILGVAGAFASTFIGQTIGWYRLDQGAGLIGATVDETDHDNPDDTRHERSPAVVCAAALLT